MLHVNVKNSSVRFINLLKCINVLLIILYTFSFNGGSILSLRNNKTNINPDITKRLLHKLLILSILIDFESIYNIFSY